MTIESDFFIFLKGYYPEAETGKRNGVFTNSQTRYLWEGFKAGVEKGKQEAAMDFLVSEAQKMGMYS